MPGFALLKEWAYAGATFAWVMAFISAYPAGEGAQIWSLPLALLALLIVSYVVTGGSGASRDARLHPVSLWGGLSLLAWGPLRAGLIGPELYGISLPAGLSVDQA